jgi:amino acid transporter
MENGEAVFEDRGGPVSRESGGAVLDKGLKTGALGFGSNLAIGVASAAPAYAMAATLGLIVAVGGVGLRAPAVLIVSFVPMLLVAVAYRHLNRADPDCGTTFAWVTRAMGPHLGWVNGWVIFLADILVMASLSTIAATYSFDLVGWHAGASSNAAIIAGSVVWIALMTFISYRGVEISARTQQVLLSAEVAILTVFAIVALAKVYLGHPAGAIHPAAAWFDPFALPSSALVDGVVLGAFVYWGWDAALSVNEESADSRRGPGKAAVLSTLLLVLIFVVVSSAAQAYAGPAFLASHSDDVLGVLGHRVFGSPWDKLLILAVLSSAAASTQTTIMPTARTTLSMAHWGAIPAVFGRVHPRFRTPTWSTLGMGAISAIWTVGLLALNPTQHVLGDAITALGFAICFYYGFTGVACAVYFRRELRRSVRNLLSLGVAPLTGGLLLFAIFAKALHDYSRTGAGYAKPLFGIQAPIVIGVGGILLGVALMLVSVPFFPRFFRRGREVAAGEPASVIPEPLVAQT